MIKLHDIFLDIESHKSTHYPTLMYVNGEQLPHLDEHICRMHISQLCIKFTLGSGINSLFYSLKYSWQLLSEVLYSTKVIALMH
jgi:hypothetical protein